jgi:hypothetical protein
MDPSGANPPESEATRKLRQSLSLLKETEQVAVGTLTELQSQREKLAKSKDGLRSASTELDKSNRIVTRIKRREECALL